MAGKATNRARPKKVVERFETILTKSANGFLYPFGIGTVVSNKNNFKAGDLVEVTVKLLKRKA